MPVGSEGYQILRSWIEQGGESGERRVPWFAINHRQAGAWRFFQADEDVILRQAGAWIPVAAAGQAFGGPEGGIFPCPGDGEEATVSNDADTLLVETVDGAWLYSTQAGMGGWRMDHPGMEHAGALQVVDIAKTAPDHLGKAARRCLWQWLARGCRQRFHCWVNRKRRVQRRCEVGDLQASVRADVVNQPVHHIQAGTIDAEKS